MRTKLQVSGLRENKILNFFLYKTDEICNYVMIVKGPVASRASIFIFDSDLRRREMPALQDRYI